jgi:hypothetical protein
MVIGQFAELSNVSTTTLRFYSTSMTSWGGAFEICLKTASYKVKEEFCPFQWCNPEPLRRS